ncbi:hypothetical protein HYH03_018166 [Edaphochlamys debaryana]|uniref:RING-type domain-containing protein n=1 Tax=Edaphochlamys debaryana TaxID=47281 RepID=A0A835XFU2_9CHLO|nr:hypothetical protein HYH03_018166 [Edaphochlamys debaryana]|eukprot:KAG2482941.1 hypothetical protein HYH03_018166 [Edaphochlamys debaryana]
MASSRRSGPRPLRELAEMPFDALTAALGAGSGSGAELGAGGSMGRGFGARSPAAAPPSSHGLLLGPAPDDPPPFPLPRSRSGRGGGGSGGSGRECRVSSGGGGGGAGGGGEGLGAPRASREGRGREGRDGPVRGGRTLGRTPSLPPLRGFGSGSGSGSGAAGSGGGVWSGGGGEAWGAVPPPHAPPPSRGRSALSAASLGPSRPRSPPPPLEGRTSWEWEGDEPCPPTPPAPAPAPRRTRLPPLPTSAPRRQAPWPASSVASAAHRNDRAPTRTHDRSPHHHHHPHHHHDMDIHLPAATAHPGEGLGAGEVPGSALQPRRRTLPQRRSSLHHHPLGPGPSLLGPSLLDRGLLGPGLLGPSLGLGMSPLMDLALGMMGALGPAGPGLLITSAPSSRAPGITLWDGVDGEDEDWSHLGLDDLGPGPGPGRPGSAAASSLLGLSGPGGAYEALLGLDGGNMRRVVRPEVIRALPRRTATRSDAPRQCPVCLERFTPGASRLAALPCGHAFCEGCVEPWLGAQAATCPVCRWAFPEVGLRGGGAQTRLVAAPPEQR